jgi:Bacterial type II/III secretion system short domain
MRLLLILILFFSATSALAQRELTSITVNYASPEQLLAVIKPHLSTGSSISLFRNQLVLNVTPDELAKTRELLERLDKAGRQLLVSLRSDGTGSDSRRGVDVDAVIRSGDTVITNSPGRRTTETRTVIRGQNSNDMSTDNGNQAVRVTEGMPAYIATGVTAPVQSYTIGTDGRRYYQQDYVNAVAGFYATTWLNGRTVRISIDQSNDQFAGQTIATQQLRSEVSGALGEWLAIGVIDNSASQRTSGLGSRDQSSQVSSTQLFIKVDLRE